MFIGRVLDPYRTLLRFYCDFNFIVRVLEGHLIIYFMLFELKILFNLKIIYKIRLYIINLINVY